MAKSKNKLQGIVNKPIFLIVAGVLLMAISGLHWYWRARALTPNEDLRFESEIASVESVSIRLRPSHITVTNLIDVDINEQYLVNGQWSVDEKLASYLGSSAKPSETGNIIVYGHNTKQVFGKLPLVKVGDSITLTTFDGQNYQYLVKETVEIDPSQIRYLMPTNEETLTIYTCSGFMDRKRWIVVAKPKFQYE